MRSRMFSYLLFACMCSMQSVAAQFGGGKSTHQSCAIDLQGEWLFQQGGDERPTTYADHISLPGSMLTNGKGDNVNVNTQWTGSLYDSSFYFNPYMQKYRVEGQMKFPFFLTPQKHYVGRAWYRREVRVPRQWRGRPVTLFLERPHIETTVFVNGREVGHRMSLSTPHEYDVTPFLRFGKTNIIDICVYNGIENVCVGQDSHSVTDQTQGNWNGIAGRMELQAGPAIWRKRVVTHLASRSADVYINDTVFHLTIDGDVQPWDEFHPVLYSRTVNYRGVDIPVTFGFRDVKIVGRQFYLNGQPIWLRGTVENCCFPQTGYPPTDVEEWLRVFRKCKEYGLNHVRFHSYCPPEAAFEAADRVGIYLQPEGPSWPNHGVRLRRGMKIDQYLIEECKAILDRYGHHPSFMMMAAGNEPAGDWVTYCNDWVKTMEQYDSTRVFCGASVGGGWAWDNGSQYHVKGGARGLEWNRHAPSASDDYADGIAFPRNYKDSVPNQSPIIAHEQGQWCAFPDFKEIPQYEGCAYQPGNFEIFRDLLRDNGMAEQAEKFLFASGRLQTLCYKYETERNLRTPDYSGFQLLGLNDYSGQGTALVGPLNVFWREKGYVDAAQWREFCSSVVPLARFPKFVFTSADTLSIPVEVYNASGARLKDARATFSLRDAQQVVHAHGLLSQADIPLGKNNEVGVVTLPLHAVEAPGKLTLTVEVATADGIVARNHWNLWVYPAFGEKPDTKDDGPLMESVGNLYISDSLDAKAIETLRQGGDVLITAAGHVRYGNDVSHTFLPVFWNTSWFKMRPPHTTGAYIQRDHPVFSLFPTDDWQDLQWWELTNHAQVMNLSEFPADYQPIVQPIDTWHVSRKLGMLVEARVLGGRLLMTTMDISSHLDQRPVARQLRKSILHYMQSDRFQPAISLQPDVIAHLFERMAPPVNMFTKDSPDELKPKIK